jgi:hypothetical protein
MSETGIERVEAIPEAEFAKAGEKYLSLMDRVRDSSAGKIALLVATLTTAEACGTYDATGLKGRVGGVEIAVNPDMKEIRAGRVGGEVAFSMPLDEE